MNFGPSTHGAISALEISIRHSNNVLEKDFAFRLVFVDAILSKVSTTDQRPARLQARLRLSFLSVLLSISAGSVLNSAELCAIFRTPWILPTSDRSRSGSSIISASPGAETVRSPSRFLDPGPLVPSNT